MESFGINRTDWDGWARTYGLTHREPGIYEIQDASGSTTAKVTFAGSESSISVRYNPKALVRVPEALFSVLAQKAQQIGVVEGTMLTLKMEPQPIGGYCKGFSTTTLYIEMIERYLFQTVVLVGCATSVKPTP